jgi:hypothetical protein
MNQQGQEACKDSCDCVVSPVFFKADLLAISRSRRSSPKCVNQLERGHQASLNLVVQSCHITKDRDGS